MQTFLLKIIAICIIPLLGLQSYLFKSDFQVLGHLITLLLLLISIINTLFYNKIITKNKNIYLIYIYLFYEITVMIHASIMGIIQQSRIISFIILIFTLYLLSKQLIRLSQLYFYLFLGLAITIILNLAGFFLLEIESPEVEKYVDQIVSNFGIINFRIYFPFVESTRVFSQISGLFSLLSIYFFLNKYKIARKFNLAYILCWVFAMMVILISDSRMVFSIVILFIIFYFPLENKLITKYQIVVISIIILILIFPIIYMPLFFTDFFYKNIYLFDISLNGRVLIWGPVLYEINSLNFWDSLFGFGAYSQVTTGLSHIYSFLFKAWYDPLMATTHNTSLQKVFDSGFVGLFIYSIINIIATTRLIKKKKNIDLLFLIYILIIGITESITSYSSFTFLFLSLVVYQNAFTEVIKLNEYY